MTAGTYLRRHARLFLAFGIGLAVALIAPLAPEDRALLGADVFFLTYLIVTWAHMRRLDLARLKRHGEDGDEGARLIVLIALIGVGVSLWAILTGLGAGTARLWPPQPYLAVASVPLGWATLNTVMAFHYAGLYYTSSGPGRYRGGLAFPGGGDPVIWDFLYFSLTLGMCAQTSDVTIARTGLRRTVALHSVLSYFYNTVILALTVNAALSLGG